MSLPRLRKTGGNDALQSAIEELLRNLANSCPLLDGRLLEDVSLPASSGEVALDHGLGRKWQGFLITRYRSGTPFVIYNSREPDDKKLYLKASGVCRVDIWVW